MADTQNIGGTLFIDDAPNSAPDMKRWTIDGTVLDIYIQPGGCLEIGDTEDEDRMFVHLCEPQALENILTLWKAQRTDG